jgi:GGDEF domain-containing protein
MQGRSEVEGIVNRLERCFDDPFVVGGYLLRGAASLGLALYPENGRTAQDLLSAADAAMYAVKNSKHLTERPLAQVPHLEPAA